MMNITRSGHQHHNNRSKSFPFAIEVVLGHVLQFSGGDVQLLKYSFLLVNTALQTCRQESCFHQNFSFISVYSFQSRNSTQKEYVASPHMVWYQHQGKYCHFSDGQLVTTGRRRERGEEAGDRQCEVWEPMKQVKNVLHGESTDHRAD